MPLGWRIVKTYMAGASLAANFSHFSEGGGPMRVVQMTVIRAISVLSILFATAGFYLMGTSIIHRLASDASSKNAAYFWSRIVVNGAFLALLTVSARYIWQIRPFGLRLSNLLFALEVGYVFGSPPVEAWLTGSGVLN